MSLSECEELMTRLKDKYPTEYKVCVLQYSIYSTALSDPLFAGL